MPRQTDGILNSRISSANMTFHDVPIKKKQKRIISQDNRQVFTKLLGTF